MSRRFVTSVLAATAAFCIAGEVHQQADAQGLLRRIRSRIESRIVAPPAGPLSQQAGATNQAAPNPNARPTPAGARVSPIGGSPNGAPEQTGSQTTSRYGGSILAPNAPKGGRPSLGVLVHEAATPGPNAQPGLEVAEFQNQSQADEAGLKKGDIIIAIDGRPTPTTSAVSRILIGKRFGQTVNAQVVRDARPIVVRVPLVGSQTVAANEIAGSQIAGVPPAVRQSGQSILLKPDVKQSVSDDATASNVRVDNQVVSDFGLEVEDAESARGAIVKTVQQKSAAQSAGLKPGDRVVSIDGTLIDGADAVADVLAKKKVVDTFTLRLVRGGKLINADASFAAKTGAATSKAKEAAEALPSLEGIGSALGGLFGSNDGAKKNEEKSKVRQVDFEEAAEKPAQDDAGSKLENDPPSLESLEPPSAEPVDRDLDESSESEILRRKIRELEDRLKQIQEDNQK